MIKPNKNKLIPCADVAWGDIKGSISMQSDLISLLSDYATESWVSEQGFMTSESLSGYATESWVEGQEYITSESLAGYATESWVSEQGFLSEVPSDYATKNWVNNKNFATKSWVSSNFLSEVPSQYATQSWVINKNYASKSWVSSNFLSEVPSEYATKSWVESNGYLSEIPSEYATKEWVSNKDYASKVWVYEQKYLKKVPSEYATQSWVSETLSSYATESWVISTLSSYTPDMSSYATKSWVEDKGYITSSALSGYATESWVESQSYITSSALSGYATESYVQEQGFLTSQSLKTINNESIIGEGNIDIEALTPQQEDALDLLMDDAEGGILQTTEIPSRSYGNIFNLGLPSYYYEYSYKMFQISPDELLLFYSSETDLYSYNIDKLSFEKICHMSQWVDYPIWRDKTGRYYVGPYYELDLTTGTVTSVSMNCNSYNYAYNKHNIFVGDDAVYVFGYDTNNFQKLNESTKEFESWSLTFSGTSEPDYMEMGKWMCEYEGHHIWFMNGCMWEFDEDNAQITELSEPYFAIEYDGSQMDGHYFHSVDGNYYYLYGQTTLELVEGQWVSITLTNTTPTYSAYGYNNWGGQCGNVLIGYSDYSWGDLYFISNITDEDVKCTFWGPVSNVAVDLSSNQTIRGNKLFDNISVSTEYVDYIRPKSQSMTIHSDNRILIETQKLEINSSLTFLNNKNVATTDKCILNQTPQTAGPFITAITNAPLGMTYSNNFWITPSGRLFVTDGNNVQEFDGTTWTTVQMSVIPINRTWRVTTTSGLYYVTDSYTYKWDDTQSDWIEFAPGQDPWSCWSCGDTVRSSSYYKLVEDNGSYIWAWDPTVNEESHGNYSVVLGSSVYVFQDSWVYQYDEQTKTFTQLGTYDTDGNNNIFIHNNEIYHTFSGGVRKVDFSKVDPQNPGVNLDVPTTIFYVDSNRFYGDCQYSNYLYVCDEQQFGTCYGVDESLPAVPNTNGTYVLKAVRTNAGVTYSWVEDVDAQAIQITNQILG